MHSHMNLQRQSFFAEQLLSGEGWQSSKFINVDDQGIIVSITDVAETQCEASFKGAVIPGMINLHSHAFQRNLVGRTGLKGAADDSFWSWREAMYQQLGQMDPGIIEAITAYCYMELLQGGYTSVAEFHYLHHQAGGAPYADPAETSRRILAAAETAGIGLTILPVLYSWAGFGQQPLAQRQTPFGHGIDSYLDLLDSLDKHCKEAALSDWGVAPHSLRAVDQVQLHELLDTLARKKFSGPLHIHIAEQQQEVADCINFYGARPVQWLLDNLPVNENWCLVHATHVNEEELEMMQRAGVVAGLCPTTEADLGDGIFPASRWQELGGAWGIGSDSNLCVNAPEELRLLEFGQRLRDQQRNLMAEPGETVGAELYASALSGGLQALAKPPARGFTPGQRADFLVLNQNHPLLMGKEKDQLLDTWVFAGSAEMLSQVWVAGQCRVKNGRHIEKDKIESEWRRRVVKY